jgi:hypothetical protein
MHALLDAIQSSALAQWLASERWIGKQLLETLHFTAFALQIGAIIVVSLRLLGVGRRVPIEALSRAVFWTAWLAFAAVLVTGALQFVPIAAEVFYRPSFRAKLAVLGVALGVLAWLQSRVRSGAAAWDAGAPIPGSLQISAALSLALWPTVVVIARLMYAFVQMAPR